MNADPARAGLRQKASRGVAWTTVDAVGTRLITTVIFILLARLLEPAAFGLVALSLVFIALMRLLVDQGFGAAIVQRKDLTKAHLDTAFWTSVLTGLVLAGALALAAHPLSALLGQRELAPVLQALSLVVVFGAPSSTAAAVLRRGFGFRSLAYRKLASALIGGVAGLAAALTGFGVWALVVQALVQAAVSTLMLWTVTPYRPGLQLSRTHFSELFTFSNKVIGISIVNFLSKRSDDLLIGSVLGPTALGLYSVAYRLLTIMTEVLTLTIEHVAFSTFSKLQSELARLRRAYQMALRTSAAITAPAYLTMAVLAPDVIVTFFGEQWRQSIPVMQLLALGGFAQALVGSSNTLLLSVGKVKTVLHISTAIAVANVVGFLIAVRFGILAVALAFALRAFLLAPLSIRPVIKVLGMSWAEWVKPLLPPIVCAVVSSGLVFALRELVLDSLPAPASLAIGGLAALVLYLGLFRLVSRRQFSELLEHIALAAPPLRRLRRRRDRAAVGKPTPARQDQVLEPVQPIEGQGGHR
jgi:O-antigen/teichoic acid export membrane protein